MLLRAVAEKYGKTLAKEGTSADSLIQEFLGPDPNSSNDKISGLAKGALDVDMKDEDFEAMPTTGYVISEEFFETPAQWFCKPMTSFNGQNSSEWTWSFL